MIKKRKKMLVCVLALCFAALIIIGVALLGYHLTGRYKETIIYTAQNLIDEVRDKFEDMEDGVRSITEASE